jgi:hypothetical protein
LAEDAQVLRLCDAAMALSMQRRTLAKKLRQSGLPVVHFSKRQRGVRISDLRQLIDKHLQPAA